MGEIQRIKMSHKKSFSITNIVLLAVGLFVIGNKTQTQTHLTTGATSYAITLDASNAPASLNESNFGNGIGYARYVEFEYTSAKRALGSHVVLNETGKLVNHSNTRITSIQAITAVFSGGQATLKDGPTISLMGNSQTLTSGVEVVFTTNPYYFSLTNTGGSPLLLETLVINYTCIHTHATIEFVENGGSPVEPMVLAPGTSISEPTTPTNPGYVFAGWFTESSLVNPYTFATMPSDDLILYAKWTVDPAYSGLTIAAFKALTEPESTQLNFVRGVVILAKAEMQLLIIADNSDTLLVFGYQDVAVGDEIRVGGYLGNDGGLTLLQGTLERPVSVDIYAHNQTFGLSPTSMTVAAFNLLNPDLASNWIVYAKITGTIAVNHTTHEISLVDGTDTMPAVVIGETDAMLLSQYEGFRVNLRGVIVPNMDNPENTILMFVFNGNANYVELDYEGETGLNELATLMEGMFRDYYENRTYFPGQYLELPAAHDVVPVTMTYETYGTNAAFYNLVTHRFANDIASEIYVDIHVTALFYGEHTVLFDVQLHVDPSIIISISAFRAFPDSNSTVHVVQAVILNSQPNEGSFFLLVADATGIIYVNTNNGDLGPGDEVVAVGYKVTTANGMVFLFNDPTLTVDHVVATNQPMPMTPTLIGLSAFNALDKNNVEANFVYYELEGVLTSTEPSNPSANMFVHTSGENHVLVYAASPASRTILLSHIDETVKVRGVAGVHRDALHPENEFVYLAFLPISGSIEVVS